MTDREMYQAAFAAYAKKHLCTLVRTQNTASLARKDNYRGKYPPIPRPAWDRTGAVNDGELYPLTNKLDYVFFKRHMVRSATGSNTWIEVRKEGNR